MRKSFQMGCLVLTASLATLSASSAFSAPKYGRAGCGLGSIIMGPTGNQTSAVTSNLGYVQAFGITSGTSNCTPDGPAEAAVREQEKFIVANLSTVSREMAQGSGDSLVAYAEVLGCSKAVYPVFAQELQRSYRDIFAAPGALAVLDASKKTLRGSSDLNNNCTHLL